MNRGKTESILWAQELFKKQGTEKLSLNEKREKEWLLKETRNKLDEDIWINEVRISMYEKLWINENQEKNSTFENLTKWVVDELIIWNFEFAIAVWDTKWKIIIDALAQLCTIEWLKNLLESIWKTVKDLLDWDAYTIWKLIWVVIWGALWYWAYRFIKSWGIWKVVGWAGWVLLSWTQIMKNWTKAVMKGRWDKKKLVEWENVNNNIISVQKRVIETVPKQVLDVETKLVEDILFSVKKSKLDQIMQKEGWYGYFWLKLLKISDDLGLEKPLKVENIIDNWAESVVVEITWKKFYWTDMVVKVPRENGVFRPSLSPLDNHKAFYSLLQEWKGMARNKVWLPRKTVLNIPEAMKYSWWLKDYYLLKNLKDYIPLETALRKKFIEKEVSWKIKHLNIDDFNGMQLETLRKKLGIRAFDFRGINLGFLDEGAFDDIRNFYWYANYMGLKHWDIRPQNLMIPKKLDHNTSKKLGVYFIDFSNYSGYTNTTIKRQRKQVSIKYIKNELIKEQWNFKNDINYQYSDIKDIDNLKKFIVK